MSNLIQRTITGALFVIVLVGSVWYNEWTFFGLFLLITVLALFEFYRLSRLERNSPQRFMGLLLGVMVYLISWLYFRGMVEADLFLLLVPVAVFIPVIELFRQKRKPFSNIGYTFSGVLYIAVPFSLFHSFSFTKGAITHYSPDILLSIFFMLWTFDTFAYLSGITIGRNRLFERISPKKTWEGFWGGTFFTLALAYYISTLSQKLPMADWFIIAGLVIVFGTLGDLVESMFKRSIGAKDSGSILPGHGGLLDRFDGIFLTSPMIFIYLQFFG